MERFEGYVVDIDCVRRWPQNDINERARKHMTTCALSGQSVESGYCIVDRSIVLLDSAATPLIINALKESDQERGVRLRITRRLSDREIETTMVELAIPREAVTSSTLRSVGYRDGVLEIEFRSGIYQYLDVPKSIYDELRTAESLGRYFNAHIKNHFQSRKLEI